MPEPGYRSISVSEAQYHEHNERRQALGLTWDEYLDGQAPELADALEIEFDADGEVDEESLREAVHVAVQRSFEDLVAEIRQAGYEGAREAVQDSAVGL